MEAGHSSMYGGQKRQRRPRQMVKLCVWPAYFRGHTCICCVRASGSQRSAAAIPMDMVSGRRPEKRWRESSFRFPHIGSGDWTLIALAAKTFTPEAVFRRHAFCKTGSLICLQLSQQAGLASTKHRNPPVCSSPALE